MVVFENLIKRLEAVKQDMPRVIKETLEDDYVQAQLIDLNTEQLSEGKLSNGRDMGFYRSQDYAELKKAIGKNGDFVDLNFTGDFYGSFIVEMTQNSIGVSATDKKTADLEERYSEDIFGLTNENFQEFKDYIFKETLIENFKKRFYGN